MSLCMSLRHSENSKPLKRGFWDISRVHLYGIARICIFVELPEGAQEDGKCALLKKST